MKIPGDPGCKVPPSVDGTFWLVGTARCRLSPRPARGFTLLELQVSLTVLAIGILGLSTLMIRQSRQITRLEAWCVPDRTYYVVTQTDPWMRAMGAPAELAAGAGQSAWVPPVSSQKDNIVTLLTYARQGRTLMSAQVTLEPNEPEGGG